MKIVYIVVLVFSLLSCRNQQQDNVPPFQRMENYNGNISFSVEERILATPEMIINSLNEMDNVITYASYELNDGEKQLFMNYYDFLPLKYKNVIIEKVVGIYFINNFLGGGMTLSVFDNSGNMYMVLFFNPKILYTSISEWINFRDNSVFIDNDNKISLITECGSNYYALIHTLVHETSHVYDFYNNVTPFTEEYLKNDQTKFPTDFIKDIWNNIDEPIEEYNYESRKNISFYGLGEKIDKKNAARIFTLLKNTPFNSLYGSKTWAEDFAESFTWYYLSEYYNTNYITIIMEDEKPIIIYDPNDNELVKRRYEIFEEIVK